MNKGITLLDKINNVPKLANTIIKFNYENKEYLIYSIDENEQNKQIFTSKLTSNSEGKYFIEDLLPEEKGKISNIIYNIIILTPTEYKKGNNANTLIENLSSKFSIKLSKDIPVLEVQEYYNNCSIAITSNELVEAALEFYDSNLKESTTSDKTLVPTWTIPTEIASPKVEIKEEIVPVITKEPSISNIDVLPSKMEGVNTLNNITNSEIISNTTTNPMPVEPTVNESSIDVLPSETESINILNNITNSEIISNTPVNAMPVEPTINVNIDNISPVSGPNITEPSVEIQQSEDVIMPINNANEENLPNPQKEKLAIVSDPSLSSIGIDPRGIQPNMQNVKKAGFAVNKNIIIGTICLVLAVAVVITAYFLIKNIK